MQHITLLSFGSTPEVLNRTIISEVTSNIWALVGDIISKISLFRMIV